VSAADAAVYAEPNDVRSHAELLNALLDDPQRRAEMGVSADRGGTGLDHQELTYVGVYHRLLKGSAAAPAHVTT
jgi:hypothetical protein